MCQKRTRYSCGHARLQSSKCRKIVARRRSTFGCFLDCFAPIRGPCNQVLQEYNFRDLLCRSCATYAPMDPEYPDQCQLESWSNIDLGNERQQPTATEDSRHMSHADRQQLRQTLEEVGDSHLPSVLENIPKRHVRKDTVRFHGQPAARDLRRRDEIPLTPLRDAFLDQETSHSRSQRTQGESSRSQHRSDETSHSRSHRSQGHSSNSHHRSREPSNSRSRRTSAAGPSMQPRICNVEPHIRDAALPEEPHIETHVPEPHRLAPPSQSRIVHVEPHTRDFSLPDEPYMETHIPQVVEDPVRQLTPIPAPVPPPKNPARGKTTRRKTSKRTCPASRSEAYTDQVSKRGFAAHRGDDLIPAPLNLTKNRVLVPPPRPSRPAETLPPAGPSSQAEPSPPRAPLSAPLSSSRFVEHLDDDIISPLSPDDIMNPQLSGRYVAAHQTAVRSAGLCSLRGQQHLSPAQAKFKRPTTSGSTGSAPTPRRRSFQESVSSYYHQLRGKESDDSFACETARAIEGSHKRQKKSKKHHRRA
ncbi:hypothetical protein CC79DRAFT_697234 [Sarocladium strictum]